MINGSSHGLHKGMKLQLHFIQIPDIGQCNGGQGPQRPDNHLIFFIKGNNFSLRVHGIHHLKDTQQITFGILQGNHQHGLCTISGQGIIAFGSGKIKGFTMVHIPYIYNLPMNCGICAYIVLFKRNRGHICNFLPILSPADTHGQGLHNLKMQGILLIQIKGSRITIGNLHTLLQDSCKKLILIILCGQFNSDVHYL